MRPSNDKSLLRMLTESLALLSSSSSEQADYIRKLATDPSVDELALELDDVWPAAKARAADLGISPETSNTIDALDAHLRSISGDHNKHLWTIDALQHSPEWKRTRTFARDALTALRLDYPESCSP